MRAFAGTAPPTNRARMAELITIVTNGHTYHWTTAEKDVTASIHWQSHKDATGAGQVPWVTEQHTWKGLGPILTRGTISTSLGVEVSSLDVEILTGGTAAIQADPELFPTANPIHIATAAARGLFDNARFFLWWAFIDTWDQVTPAATALMFSGFVAEVNPTPVSVKMSVKTPMERLNIKFPRNVFGPRCHWQLYGRGCGINRFAKDGQNNYIHMDVDVCSPDCTTTLIIGNKSANVTIASSNGWLEFAPPDDSSGTTGGQGGRNAGQRRQIVGIGPTGGYQLAYPLPYAPVVNDAFTVYMGCNRQGEKFNVNEIEYADYENECAIRFDNAGRNRAFPHVPTDTNVYKSKPEK